MKEKIKAALLASVDTVQVLCLFIFFGGLALAILLH